MKCKQNPPKFEFQGTIYKFKKCEIKHFYVIHEVVQRWQRKVNRLTHVQSCWFAYYTSITFDILIEVELFDPKVPISLIIVKARLDSLMSYSRAINY